MTAAKTIADHEERLARLEQDNAQLRRALLAFGAATGTLFGVDSRLNADKG